MPTAAQNFGDAQEFIKDPNILLMEFWVIGDATIHRAAQNNEDVTHLGEVYPAHDLGMRMPDESDEFRSVSLSIPNIDRIAGQAVADANNQIACRLFMVQRGAHDTIVMDTKNLMIAQRANANRVYVTGDLVPRADPRVPGLMPATSKKIFPGLY